MTKRLTRGELIVLVAGPVTLLGSFLPFFSYEGAINVWDAPIFPIATLIALLAIVAAGLVGLVRLGGLDLSRGALGFGYSELLLVVGASAGILAVAFLFSPRAGGGLGVGFILLLLGGVGSTVGAVLVANDRDPGPASTQGRRGSPWQ